MAGIWWIALYFVHLWHLFSILHASSIFVNFVILLQILPYTFVLNSSKIVGKSGASCNSFYSNPYSVKRIENTKLLFISLGSPGCTWKGHFPTDQRLLNGVRKSIRQASKYVGRAVTCTNLFSISFSLSRWNLMKSTLFCLFYTSDISAILSARCFS